ncbi:MAG: phosphopentomutase [Desulfuromonadaceae bacterium]|nr:phosphopentomutase [Desulfuromonadaceae bacterium]
MKAPAIRRVFVIVLDGVGIGAAPDAADYGDEGANTLFHVLENVSGLTLPTLARLGLGNIVSLPRVPPAGRPLAAFGSMEEASAGKDTIVGHWELAGLISRKPFAVYPQGFPCEIIAAFRKATGLSPLGNVAASGTEIIRSLGAEHIRSGRPILYTSADSVLQIAAHEEILPPPRLYEICRLARGILDPYRVARVIARPFTGRSPENFRRIAGRRDFAMAPSEPTILDRVTAKGLPVFAIGKIFDIFAGRGITRSFPTLNNADGMATIEGVLDFLDEGLVMANLVDFDTNFGHRRDVCGFGAALVELDAWLKHFIRLLGHSDLLILSADHGCDPTRPGSDHTREVVPLLVYCPKLAKGKNLGRKKNFTEVAALVGAVLGCQSAGGTLGIFPLAEEGE